MIDEIGHCADHLREERIGTGKLRFPYGELHRISSCAEEGSGFSQRWSETDLEEAGTWA
jgi:hypothetical protein